MTPCARFSGLLVCLAASVAAQQAKPPAAKAPIVQPGAPGKASKTLPPSAAHTPSKAPNPADIAFMQGMIHHHAQAVEMVELLRTRAESKALRAFGERIAISQTDEIEGMKQWLRDRGQPIAPAQGHDHNMAGMNHAAMAMPLMPGMLTPEQMKELAAAKGAAFDRLFLIGMIQHHNGALIMVDELFAAPGGGQDPTIYDFATDIDNTQSAEIELMRGMLKEK